MADQSRIELVIGPTAGGKTRHAIDLATRHDGVILNADSMQIYDAIPTLTAQPDAQEKSQAPHRLFGCLHPNDLCGAGRWRGMVITEIDAILAKNKRPILVGGSGFYINALLKGFSPIPDIPPDIRASLDTLNQDDAYARLQKCDPILADKLHPNDRQRVIRGLEVYAHTDRALSDWQSEPLTPPPVHYDFHITAILPERQNLYDKINRRVEIMAEGAMMAEVETLHHQALSGEVATEMPILKACGFPIFRQVVTGDIAMDEAIQKTQQETRHYAKRQMTWLRNQITADTVIS